MNPEGTQAPQVTPAIRAGLVNAHTHLYSGLAPLGMPSPEVTPANFVEILERIWWRLDRALDAESLDASAQYYVAASLGLGTGLLIDHHESPNFIEGSLDVLRDACEGLGMSALLCYGITERNGGREEARRGLAENRRFLTTNRCPTVRGAVGIHASFTVSDESIVESADLAREFNAPLHIHVAEDMADVHDAKKRGYGGVVERLDKLGALQEGSILAHGVHLTQDEVALVSERGCWLVQNPRSNRSNAVGYPAHLGSASRVALGTDGYPSNMQDEAAALAEDAKASGNPGEVAAAARRPLAGLDLAKQLFPDLDLTQPSAPNDDALRTIQSRAETQAKRLWERMETL